MRRSLHSIKENSAILVIDALELRRAGVVSLLRPWADSSGMRIVELNPQVSMLGGRGETSRDSYRMILLVVGAMGVCDPEPQSWIASLSSLYANTPLVLVSDREDATEVVAALEAGARGFIPTSIAPQVAIHACAFIISGGSYFPPAALTQAARVNQIAPGASKQLTVVATASVQRTGLTARQQEVLELLRQGESNKLIGRQLKLRESTVKVHVRQIMRKLGASNRTQAALTAAHLSVVATDREASTETEASEPEDNGDATKCPPLPAARSAPEPKAAAPALTSRLVPR